MGFNPKRASGVKTPLDLASAIPPAKARGLVKIYKLFFHVPKTKILALGLFFIPTICWLFFDNYCSPTT
jgi:hypothetical protein